MVLETIIGQNNDAFQQSYQQYGKMVCRLADGKKEDACYYFCTLIRLIDNKLHGMGISTQDNDPKMLLEQGRNTGCYGEMMEIYQKLLSKYREAVKSSLIGNDKKDIWKAKEYIEKHYQENLTLGVLAEEVHMNPYYFSSFFKKQAGENFKDYVNKVRMEHAVSLLVSSDKKTYEIAVEVGYGDVRAFNEVFQRLYHETPSAYRKRVSRSYSG
jgi:two-component system response regulator YesN